jgi:hypothetical protein
MLLYDGWMMIPIRRASATAVRHEGVFCFNCGFNNDCICGQRFKCVNCADVDCCENEEC